MGNKILKLLGLSSVPIIGIDIGSSAVKLLQLERKNNQYSVERYAIESLLPGVVVEKTIKKPEEVVKALKKLVEKANIKVKEVAACISVPNSEAITRVIQLDASLNERDIQAEIELEADKYIPYSLNEVNMDFTVLGPSPKSEEQIDVLITASKSENVDRRAELLAQANLKTQIVDIESFAMERSFALVVKQLPVQGENQVIAVVDIGATLTTLNIFQNNRSIYLREQSFGGQHLLDEIQTRYGLSYEEAVLARKRDDLPDDYITEVLQPFRESVAKQVSRSCQFFFSAGGNNEIDYLLLTGGTSNISGLSEFIFSEIGIKAAMANPFTDMLFSSYVQETVVMENAVSLMNCCGLALRNCENK